MFEGKVIEQIYIQDWTKLTYKIYIYIFHSIDAVMTIKKKKSGDKKAGKNIASCFLKKTKN